MTRSLAVAAAIVLAGGLVACADDRDPPVAARCDQRLEAAFGAWARAGFSGSVAVSTGGRFDCLSAWGSANDATGAPNTVDTVFSIGSVTKAVTAATILDLVDAGKLTLDDRAGSLLPQLTGPVAGVTVRQLLLHTSGLTGSHGSDHQPLGRDAALAAIGRLELAFKPGAGYLYSNAGYTLLALIIEKASGYRRYTVSRMLRLPDGRVAGGFWDGEPAAPGPRAAGYLDGGRAGEPGDFAGPHWAVDGNGGLAMTVRDLADWTHALFTGRLVSPESVRAISGTGAGSERPGWVAVDASAYGTPVLAAAGGGGDVGHSAVVVWVPRGQRVIAIASNRARISAEDLLAKAGPALLAGRPLPTPSPPAAATGPAATGPAATGPAATGPAATGPAATGPAAVAGRYRLDSGGTFAVTGTGDQLTISATGVDAVAALFPPGGVPAADFRANERRVLELLTGRTREGRTERESLERAFGGSIRGVDLAGTVFRDGEIRSYVTIAAARGPITGWYAVNAAGGIEAAEVPAEPPALTLVRAGGDRYRPDDPVGAGPDVTVELRDGRLTFSGPAGRAVAKRAG